MVRHRYVELGVATVANWSVGQLAPRQASTLPAGNRERIVVRELPQGSLPGHLVLSNPVRPRGVRTRGPGLQNNKIRELGHKYRKRN